MVPGEDAGAVAKRAGLRFRRLEIVKRRFQQRRLPEPTGIGIDAKTQFCRDIQANKRRIDVQIQIQLVL
ncbi:hypothetical protein D9M71_644280 [compost metagenome]